MKYSVLAPLTWERACPAKAGGWGEVAISIFIIGSNF